MPVRSQSRTNFLILFLVLSTIVHSQKKALKRFESKATQIEISTIGLDDFVLENSTSSFVEIYLMAENASKQHIVHKEKNNTLKIDFKSQEISKDTTAFRSINAKSLEKISVIIKIPNNKTVIIFGENINIESKNYGGTLDIYIEKGILKLNTIQANTNVKLYAGTIDAIIKNTNIDVASNNGTISVNKKIQQEIFYKKRLNSAINFKVSSVKANVFLTTQKTQ